MQRLPKSDAFECGSDISAGFITGGQEAKSYPHSLTFSYCEFSHSIFTKNQLDCSRLPKSDTFECGSDVSSGFITGGQEAKRGQFPFAALLGYEDLKGRSPTGIVYLCGATLINR